MKNIQAFNKRSDCLDFILSELITNHEFHNNHFYRGLIEWVVDHRAPIFYELSVDYEYSHFTQYFNFILVRKNYSNCYLRSMYYLHDFMHMIFNNPIPPSRFTFNKFSKLAIANEFYASNETEILIYYRIPELRDKTISNEILYDLLKNESIDPDIKKLFKLRNKLVYGGLDRDEYNKFKNVLPFFKRFTENNLIWCKLWYDLFPQNTPHIIQLSIPHAIYNQKIDDFRLALSENIYLLSLKNNLKLASWLSGLNLQATKELSTKLENVIFLEEIARKFHNLYQASKDSYQKEQISAA